MRKTAYEMRISDWSSDVCSSDLTVSALRRWADIADAIDDGPEPPPPPPTEARLSRSLDGRGHMSGSFDSAETEVIGRGLDLASSPDAEGERRTLAHKQGPAIAAIGGAPGRDRV